MSVSLSTTILDLQATRRDINIFIATNARKINGDFPETAAFEREKLAVSLVRGDPSLSVAHASYAYN